MATVNSDVDVSTIALSKLALPAISALSERAIVAQTYEVYVEGILSGQTWTFAHTQVQLSKNTAAPLVRWRDSYALPTDRIGNPLAVYRDPGQGSRYVVDFQIFGDALHCNEDQLFIDYRFRAPEAVWPPYFVNFVVIALAALWAIPLTEDQSKADGLEVQAFGPPGDAGRGGLFRTARQLDSSGAGLNVIEDNSLIAARVGANASFR